MRRRLLNFTICLVIALAAFTFAATAAKADQYDVSLTFQSGATFTGTLTFDAGNSTLTEVDGTLSGYSWSPANLTSFPTTLSGSDHIGWVWQGGCGSGSDCLMDSPSPNYAGMVTDAQSPDQGYQYWIWLFWNNHSGTPIITSDATNTTEVGFGAAGTAYDPMVGETATLTPVPEPSSLAFLGTGVLGLGFLRRKLFS